MKYVIQFFLFSTILGWGISKTLANEQTLISKERTSAFQYSKYADIGKLFFTSAQRKNMNKIDYGKPKTNDTESSRKEFINGLIAVDGNLTTLWYRDLKTTDLALPSSLGDKSLQVLISKFQNEPRDRTKNANDMLLIQANTISK